MEKRRVWLLLFIAFYYLLFIISAVFLLEPYGEPDIIDMCIEGSLFASTFLLLALFQFFRGPKEVYSNITLGLLLTGFYHCSDLLDEIRLFPQYIEYFVDDLSHLISRVFIIIGVLRWMQYNNRMFKDLKALATTDGLTGLVNRQHIDTILEEQRLAALRYNRALAIVLLDIDTFKQINDTHGHGVGDSVLKDLASLLSAMVRETDFVGRYGGEEFLIVLPETALTAAQVVAEKVRQAIESHAFPTVGRVTASFGIATLDQGETLRDFVHRADEALYVSKSTGRNRVSIADKQCTIKDKK